MLLSYCLKKTEGGEDVNANLFKSKMIASGYTQKTLADELGISLCTLNSKINGKADFRQTEISAIMHLLSLSPEDVDHIFFAS